MHPNDQIIAHRCSNRRVRPYPSVLCSTCRTPPPREDELSVNDLVRMVNDDTETIRLMNEADAHRSLSDEADPSMIRGQHERNS